jgi:hypothetical protein
MNPKKVSRPMQAQMLKIVKKNFEYLLFVNNQLILIYI